ncbi:hypothetical protein HCN44_000351 [Aphidius gifuensis]|uniref:Uncharacterized protein n=1 Tax=Aphidius gifuensis TaxID=684658 RepID=A0A834XQV0_APHGI|nr:hypothetical protein HCN44_000351 [Aphidius gifuensis]
MEQPCNMHVSATAGLNDLECAHTDDIENELIPAFYKRVHLKGPIDNSQKKIKRLEVIENVLNEVVNETDVSSDNDDMSMFESSPYFDSDITEDDHYDEPLQKVSLSKMKQKTNIEQEISLTSSSKKVKDTSSFTLEKQLLQSEIVICDTETTTFNDKISKTNFFTLDNDNNHQEDCSVSDPLDINLPKPKPWYNYWVSKSLIESNGMPAESILFTTDYLLPIKKSPNDNGRKQTSYKAQVKNYY